MKVRVNQDGCIGCGACTGYSDKVFTINDDGISEVKVNIVPKEEEQNVRDAIDACPTSTIEEVSE